MINMKAEESRLRQSYNRTISFLIEGKMEIIQCPFCKGSGKLPEYVVKKDTDVCHVCRGNGEVDKKEHEEKTALSVLGLVRRENMIDKIEELVRERLKIINWKVKREETDGNVTIFHLYKEKYGFSNSAILQHVENPNLDPARPRTIDTDSLYEAIENSLDRLRNKELNLPSEEMRCQFRYEIVQDIESLIDRRVFNED